MKLEARIATSTAALTIGAPDELAFKGRDFVKLEATIGDAAQNHGLEELLTPTGPIAVYHLEATLYPIFWLANLLPSRMKKLDPCIDPCVSGSTIMTCCLRFPCHVHFDSYKVHQHPPNDLDCVVPRTPGTG